jgi:hypothetical protein
VPTLENEHLEYIHWNLSPGAAPNKAFIDYFCEVVEEALYRERQMGREPTLAEWEASFTLQNYFEGKAIAEELHEKRSEAWPQPEQGAFSLFAAGMVTGDLFAAKEWLLEQHELFGDDEWLATRLREKIEEATK